MSDLTKEQVIAHGARAINGTPMEELMEALGGGDATQQATKAVEAELAEGKTLDQIEQEIETFEAIEGQADGDDDEIVL